MALDLTAGLSTMFDEVGVAATFTPAGGAGVSVTVIRDVPVETLEFSAGPGVNAGRNRLLLRASEVAAPARDDTVTIGATTLKVAAPPLLDPSGAVWTLECR